MYNEINDTTWKVCNKLLGEGYEVALNQKNSYGFPVFHSSGTNRSVPDILLYDPVYKEVLFNYEDTYINKTNKILAGFIETKKGDKLNNIFKGNSQILQYYIYWTTEQCNFYLNKKKLTHIDIYALATDYSSEGMLYHGDSGFRPKKLLYLSDRYDILFYPYTHSIFTSLMNEKTRELKRMREKNMVIRRPETELGIIFSRIPQLNGPVTDEFWFWSGSNLRPLTTKKKMNVIKINTEIKATTAQAAKVENLEGDCIWLPKSEILENITIQDIGTKKTLNISLWLYNRNQSFFGIK
ncbi:MAG: hypothetical protein ACFFDB_02790 [Promethearchaeota archaeon]